MALYQVPERPNSPYAGSIADLIGQAAAIQAQRLRDVAGIQANVEQNKGLNRGNTIATLGQLGAQTIGGILQQKQQQKQKLALDQYLASGNVTIGGLVSHGFRPQDAAAFVKANTPEPPKTREVKVRNPDGSESIDIVPDVVGGHWDSAPEQPKTGTREITVRTPEGGTLHKIVPDIAGTEFPEPPPPQKMLTMGAPQPYSVKGKVVLLRTGSDNAMYDMQGQPVTDPIEPRPSKTEGTDTASDVKDTIAGMRSGILPPLLPGRASKEYVALMAEAQRQGFDLAGAATDWQATQKHIATLNGAQQTRLRQSVDNAYHSLDVIDQLADKWKGGKFPILNRANLTAAKNGAYGQDVASVAQQLEAQISDLTSELGNVYMGGNSPTDHALKLAGKNLSADWSQSVLKDMVKLARTNLKTRVNSMNNVGVAGASADNPYAPSPTPARIYYDSNGNPLQK